MTYEVLNECHIACAVQKPSAWCLDEMRVDSRMHSNQAEQAVEQAALLPPSWRDFFSLK